MAAKAISTISIAWPASGGIGRPKRSFPPSADELMSAAELAAGASPRPASASAHVPPKASAKPLAGKPAKRAGAAEPAPAPAPVKKSSSAIDLAPRASADAKPRDDPVGGPPRPALEGVRKALLDPEPPPTAHRPLQVPVVERGEPLWCPSLPDVAAHHRSARAELPDEALRLDDGEPALEVRYRGGAT